MISPWCTIVEKCWAQDPKERPTAEEAFLLMKQQAEGVEWVDICSATQQRQGGGAVDSKPGDGIGYLSSFPGI